ncbi:hypothetical protein F66182_9426 [Fusarium sp. NRRL 66182]|nr:hypothetical protein F66182_9426 [Fusarium sp. NRRL 66182]
MGRRADWKALLKTLTFDNKGLGESFIRYLMRVSDLRRNGCTINSENSIRVYTRRLGGLYKKYTAEPWDDNLRDHLRQYAKILMADDVHPLSNARPLSWQFLPVTVSDVDKRIDFCMNIESSADASAPNSAAAIDDLRASLPQNSINHTSYIALGPYPVWVSLETKRTGHDYDNALLQTGAVGRRLRSGSNQDGSDITGANDTSPEASVSIDRYVNDAVSKLQALHWILIQDTFWEEFWAVSGIKGEEHRGRVQGLAEAACKIGAILRLA